MTREEILSQAKPIRFDTEMVRATLDDKKTVTRQVCHIKINDNTPVKHNLCCTSKFPETNIDGLCANFYDINDYYKGCAKPPYKVGDYLYVRETWAINNITPHDPDWLYKADYDCTKLPYCNWKWRPLIHMPKEAARIFLRVTSVRVERLRDITVNDIYNEGIPECFVASYCTGVCDKCYPLKKFLLLWNSTVKKSDLDKYGWEANPWVWVIEFEKVEVTDDE